ncbi:MAG: hypothetical protein LBB13_01740, partial [Rickettsiales bacterium]|nr:hypothetical protein [Rickettsiales bacterium]
MTNFVFHCGLAVAIIFNIVAVSRAKAENVNDFGELQSAINNTKAKIAIKKDIDFTANGPLIDYNDMIISGPSENAPGLLNGGSNYKLLTFGVNAKKISLKNLNLINGNNNVVSSDNNGGGAIHFSEEIVAVTNLENISFIDNQAMSHGGAIYSSRKETEAQDDNLNTLNFVGKTTFKNNRTTGAGSNGGALYIKHSLLIFEKVAIFEKNSSKDKGGAIYAEHFYFINLLNRRTIHFREGAIFRENNSLGEGGGAIYVHKDSLLAFGGPATFENNSSASYGGAVCSVQGSQLIFEKSVTFKNNSSGNRGGAVYTGLCPSYKPLVFGGSATFEKNISRGDGGAISIFFVNATFGELATFKNNSSEGNGGAIFAGNGVSIEFNDGLRLIENITGRADSGALHVMNDLSHDIVTIKIVQKNPLVPTEFRGNTSGNGGHNAVYMVGHSQLEFTVEKGNVDVYDVFTGEKDGFNNTVAINRGEGWFNFRRGGSIENVTFINLGNLSTVGPLAKELRPIFFINNGRIRFGIFRNGKNDRIIAKFVGLGQNSILELVADRGTYRAGDSYDILIAENEALAKFSDDGKKISVGDIGEISVESSQGIIARGRLKDGSENKIYQIVIEKDITIETYPEEMRIFSNLTSLDSNQMFLIDLLTDIFRDRPEDENINNLLDRISKFSDQEDQKTALSQISPSLLIDIITMNLLSSQGNVINRHIPTVNTLAVEPIYSNSKLTSGLVDNAVAIRLNYGHSFRNLMFGRDLSLAFFGDLTNHSLRDSQSSKASILGLAMAFRLETEVINGINIALNLSYR